MDYLIPEATLKTPEDREREQKEYEKIAEVLNSIIMTTTPYVDGYKIVKYLDIESVEYVMGTGVLSEFTTDIKDFFGARSTAFESKLKKAKNHVLNLLKIYAHQKGGNAVIGIDLNYTEFSGNRIGLIANGTIVKIEPIK